MQYNLTPVEILKTLGFDQPAGRERLQAFQETAQVSLPKVYTAFMEYAMDCPLLGTSEMEPRFLYDDLSDEEKAEVCNYLVIGSDYAAGIVEFGLRVEDLGQDDPPVYMQHEANPRTQWDPAYETLTDYLREVTLNALALVEYSTAEEEIEECGWRYTDYSMDYWEAHAEDEGECDDSVTEETLRQKGIDPEQVRWCECTYTGKTFCCYDEASDLFYVGRWDFDEENTLYIISRTDGAEEDDD